DRLLARDREVAERLDSTGRDFQRRYLEALYECELEPERDHLAAAQDDSLYRIRTHDLDGDRMKRGVPAHLSVRIMVAGTAMSIERYDEDARHPRLSALEI